MLFRLCGSACASALLRMRTSIAFQPAHDFKQPISFPRRVFAPGFAPLLRSPGQRGGRSAEKRSGACEAPVGHAITRRTRRLRGALRPMTRDARLSALHRGGFSPGAALASPAFAPDRLQRAPRSQVVVPGGRLPEPPGANGYKPPPQDATPRFAFRIVSRRRPSMSKAANPIPRLQSVVKR
jgi:hypothetical protein